MNLYLLKGKPPHEGGRFSVFFTAVFPTLLCSHSSLALYAKATYIVDYVVEMIMEGVSY